MTGEPDRVASLFESLLHAPVFRFPPLRVPLDAPERQGVYVILSPQRHVVHVGRTQRAKRGLFQRLRNHMLNASSFTEKYLAGDGHRLRNRYFYRYLAVPHARTRALLEAYAVGVLCPKHLGVGEGAT